MKKLTTLLCTSVMVGMMMTGSCYAEEVTAEAGVTEAQMVQSEKKDLVIGYSDWGLVNSWRVQMQAEFEYAIQDYMDAGIVSDYILCNANNDIAKQISDIKDLIAKDVDIILVSAINTEALNAVIGEAMDAGITVVAFAQLPSTDYITSKVNYNEVEYGRICGEFMADALNGEGKVVALRFTAGTSTDDERQQGFEEGIEGTDIEIIAEAYVEGDYAQAHAAMEDFIAAYGDEIDGVWAMGGQSGNAAIDAMEAAGMDLVPTTGEGGNGFLRCWYNHLGEVKVACPCAPTFTCVKAMEVAIQAVNGEEVDSYYDIEVPVITEDNIEEYFKPDLSDSYWCYTTLPETITKDLFE